jgi:hypothetical protein
MLCRMCSVLQPVTSVDDLAGGCLQVRRLLLGLPQQKWVFTNCSEKHAWHALQLLGLQVLLLSFMILACACEMPKVEVKLLRAHGMSAGLLQGRHRRGSDGRLLQAGASRLCCCAAAHRGGPSQDGHV